MTEIERVPRAGYLLGEVYTLEQHYKVLSPEELGGGDLEDVSAEATEEEVERDFQIVWDWQIVREGVFAVFLGIGVHPTRQAPEEIRVAIIGEFAVEGEAQSLRFQPFVQVSAPAILFPYLRETVRSLTGRGPYGGWTVPPVNVVALAKRSFDFENATGTRELRENPDLARGFGLEAGAET